jgi:histidinol phosphatase-like enzyme
MPAGLARSFLFLVAFTSHSFVNCRKPSSYLTLRAKKKMRAELQPKAK